MKTTLTFAVLTLCFLSGCETEQETKTSRPVPGRDAAAPEKGQRMTPAARRQWEETSMRAAEQQRESRYR
jgi:hypothetical protein